MRMFYTRAYNTRVIEHVKSHGSCVIVCIYRSVKTLKSEDLSRQKRFLIDSANKDLETWLARLSILFLSVYNLQINARARGEGEALFLY